MAVNGIDSTRIQAMLHQLREAAQRPEMGKIQPEGTSKVSKGLSDSEKVDFSAALKASLEQVNNSQLNAKELGERFVLGDDKVSLSDVMIAGQKANVAFQATVQVRNKLVSAYQDIMNMPV